VITELPLFYWSLLAAGLVAASVADLRRRRVPNWLTVGILFGGLLARLLMGGPHGAFTGLAGAGVGLLVLLLPFSRDWVGGGDVKLLAACGGWLGPLLVLEAVLVGAVAGGIISVTCLLRSPAALRREMLLNLKMTYLARRAPDVALAGRPLRLNPPYAPALALGTLLAVLDHAQILVA
jgi:prepilin peptidase CpaA